MKERKKLLRALVKKLEKHAQYADALYSENRTWKISRDATETEFQEDADAGVKLRAYDGRQFIERCVQGWQPARLREEVEDLCAFLQDNKPRGRTRKLKVSKKKIRRDFSTRPGMDPEDVPADRKAGAISDIHKRVMDRGFVNCQVTYREEHETRIFINRYRELQSRWSGCTVAVLPFVQADDGVRHDYYSNFAPGFEATDLHEDFEEFLARAAKLKDARRIEPGRYEAVLSPNVAGLLAHESFGHGMEADTVRLGRARAADYIGKKIAPVSVSIADDPSIEGTHGFLFFDDEGNLPGKTLLVERGEVKQPITDLYSATSERYSLSANGRAESFDHKAYARMTNTFFERGKRNVEKMIAGVRDGVYLHAGSSGMEDPKGWGVQIAGILAERIKDGKLTGDLYSEVAISGFLPDILGNVKAVGNDFEIEKDAGFCGKNTKEWVRVSSGGPHLLIKDLELS